MSSSNFEFLKTHDPVFFELAFAAERAFAGDPNTTLFKLRQMGEALARDLAARSGVDCDPEISQADLLYRLNRQIRLDPMVLDLFHTLRREGNKAVHTFKTRHKEALDGLRVARTLAIWFHRSFGEQGPDFRPGPFVPPPDPSRELRNLQTRIEQLKSELQGANQQIESDRRLNDLLAEEKAQFETLAEEMATDARTYEELALEHETALGKQRAEFENRLNRLKTELESRPQAVQEVVEQTRQAGESLVLTEALTRILIDRQLNAAGWEADSEALTYAKGARPEKGKNRAIAEWPTQGKQSADYILFAGLIPIAVAEAKRDSVDVPGKIPQAERYARGFKPSEAMTPAWEAEGRTIAWPYEMEGHYQIPFVYSCNGRPFVKQLAEASGVWFRDVRTPSNPARALHEFHSPEGLLDKLRRSREAAEARLRREGFGYLQLRDYQERAIQAVEAALETGRTECLVAMATGTGKTRAVIGLMYRFLKSERFRRILFLVDRNALGKQALDFFNEATLEQNQPLSKIYNVARMGDMAAEAETRIQVATVQAMVRRVFQSDDPPGVDAFDCLIVDEAHRGYTLDQEMTDGELVIRDQAQYLSSYRRVLDYFDAVRIGLTATPAKHTTEVFGRPVYTYPYREAVADDWLIDHEPPIRYETLLSRQGIHFDSGETVSALNLHTGQVEITELADELDFEVEAFNRRVITEGFNRVICRQLARELDPFGDEKTLVFCALDRHADMVKRLLDEAFGEVYGDAYHQDAVRKITGKSVDVDTLIRRFKNERYPSIGITVDLLTTGIDVDTICHIVFLRRVKSRILYEQMIGRPPRRCDRIGKTVFRIYDPVDIYAALEPVSTMKPLVKNPNVTLDQLAAELADPKSREAPGSRSDTTHVHDVLDAMSQKIMRVLRRAAAKAEQNPQIRDKLVELENLWGVPPEELHRHLRELGPDGAAVFLKTHGRLVQQVEEVSRLIGSDRYPIISEHTDELLNREQTYGPYDRPRDYLESFSGFIRSRINESAALAVVVNRPRDLTRAQLREIRLLLDRHGFSEAKLRSAWRNQTNQEIAAGIIGHIRRAALGEPLVPFARRVEGAMEKIYDLHDWTPVQRKWLDRLAKQLVHEAVLDRDFVNRVFAIDGGDRRLDALLEERLDEVLEKLAASVWDAAG